MVAARAAVPAAVEDEPHGQEGQDPQEAEDVEAEDRGRILAVGVRAVAAWPAPLEPPPTSVTE